MNFKKCILIQPKYLKVTPALNMSNRCIIRLDNATSTASKTINEIFLLTLPIIRFDQEMMAVQEELRGERSNKEKIQRERDQILSQKYSFEQEVSVSICIQSRVSTIGDGCIFSKGLLYI